MSVMSPTYLDYNATAPLKPAAKAAMIEAMELTGNPSSVHRFGRLARRQLEESRTKVAALAGAPPSRVIFTSGGTEANGLALFGSGRQRALVSAIEHDSVRAAARRLPDAEEIPVAADGFVDLAALGGLLGSDAGDVIVSVMLANNETGVVQPVAEIAALAHARGALVHCDAVQAAGKLSLDMVALGVDLLTISGHKIGGPSGIGALMVRDGLDLVPLMVGGGQERRRRGGTENLTGIAGFGAAAEEAAGDIADQPRLATLRDRIEAAVRALSPRVRVFGADAPRLANTSCLSMPGVASEIQVMAFDLAGVAISAGAACSSGKVAASHVLRAMGVDESEAASAIRVSLGWRSGAADVDAFLQAWGELYARADRRDTHSRADRRDAAPAA
jgi:cysteine desulfurase